MNLKPYCIVQVPRNRRVDLSNSPEGDRHNVLSEEWILFHEISMLLQECQQGHDQEFALFQGCLC